MGMSLGFDVPDQCPCGWKPKHASNSSGYVLNHWKDLGVVTLDSKGFKFNKQHPHIVIQEPIVHDAPKPEVITVKNAVIQQVQNRVSRSVTPDEVIKKPSRKRVNTRETGAILPWWLTTILTAAAFMTILVAGALLFAMAFLLTPLVVTSALYGPLRFWAVLVRFFWQGGVTVPVSLAMAVIVLVPQYRKIAWRMAIQTTIVGSVISVASVVFFAIWWLI